MKILVTGGAGFIASHVAQAYLDAGHQVVVLDNLSSGTRDNLPPGARFIQADVRDPGLAELLAAERFAVINHHAAQISVPASVQDPRFDAEVNLLGLINLLQAGTAHGLERFIFISSGGAIYGDMDDPPASEDLAPRPASPYAVAKLAGEYYLDYFAQNFGLPTVTLRYANVYGPRQVPHGEAGVVAIFMDCLMTGRPPVIYRHAEMPRGMARDYVYVADCVAANLAALEAGQGAYNIGTGVETTTLELWQTVQRAAGRELDHSFGPVRAGDIKRSALDASRAARELGWRPAHDLSAGLAETWAWRLARG